MVLVLLLSSQPMNDSAHLGEKLLPDRGLHGLLETGGFSCGRIVKNWNAYEKTEWLLSVCTG